MGLKTLPRIRLSQLVHTGSIHSSILLQQTAQAILQLGCATPILRTRNRPLESAATFDWIITPVAKSNNYTISSTTNPFSIVFSNASMSLMNAGQADEHYFFQMNTQKPTKPASQLGSQNVASTCYFNQTTFQGYLYTQMAKTYPNNGTNDTNTSDPFTPWPYAVKIEEVAAACSWNTYMSWTVWGVFGQFQRLGWHTIV
jgi:hypothetical protein